MDAFSSPTPIPAASTQQHTRQVFVEGLGLDMLIGVYAHEMTAPQPVIISLNLTVEDDVDTVGTDDPKRIVCYDNVTRRIRDLCAQGHVGLVETLAERIAALCLEDDRVLTARVRVEKPDALPDCRSVGVEVERHRSRP